MCNGFAYSGDELELFGNAINWKTYWSNFVRPFVGKTVLDVGAGIGSTAELFVATNIESWLCIDPDSSHCDSIKHKINVGLLPDVISVKTCTSIDLDASEVFDTILYIDVLEHIEDDAKELNVAASLLSKGGHLIVISPAHQWLYSPFDEKIGHFRRYSKSSLRNIMPVNLTVEHIRYIDSVGLFASMANKLILKATDPSLRQILMWDRRMIPLSVIFDPYLRYAVGKSLVGVFKKQR